MSKRAGRKSASQTPAPQKERIYGSEKNIKGSASSKSSAKSIELSEQTLTALKNKVKEYNKENKNKVTLNTLKAVYRRGAGAYSSSHRPTITGGAPNTRNAWAMARVNKFLKKKSGQSVKKAYVQDDDLLENGGEVDLYKPSNLTPEFKNKIFVHETNAKTFDRFDLNKVGGGQGDQWLGGGIYLQEKGSFKIEKYGKNKVETTLKPNANIFKVKDKKTDGKYRDNFVEWAVENTEVGKRKAQEIIDNGLWLYNLLPRDILKSSEAVEKLKEQGYDGLYQDGELVIYNPDVLQIKKFYDTTKYVDGGLIAPNGKPSNLTPEQWNLVRTPEFKAWFGDWENDPENASKLLDDNNEPIIAYHGTNTNFNEFSKKFIGSRDSGFYGKGFYFTFYPYNPSSAKGEAKYYGNIIIAAFIKTINPFDISTLSEYKGEKISFLGVEGTIFMLNLHKIFPNVDFYGVKNKEYRGGNYDGDLEIIYRNVPIRLLSDLFYKYEKEIEWVDKGDILYAKKEDKIIGRLELNETNRKNGFYGENLEKARATIITKVIEDIDKIVVEYQPEGIITRNPIITKLIIENEFDAIIQSMEGDEVVVFEPNQIKLADGTNTTFDPENPDIRYDDGGKVMKGYQYYTRTHSDGRVENFSVEEYEREHYGAGILFYCFNTNRILLIKRSEKVSHPNRWGIAGGGKEIGETSEKIAKRECLEEIGYEVKEPLKQIYIFSEDGYEFETFLCCIKDEFTPILNWESSDYVWVEPNQMPQNLQYGFKIMCIDVDLDKKLADLILCDDCGWNWTLSETTPEEMFICHKCNHNNMKYIVDKALKPAVAVETISAKHGVPLEQVQEEYLKGVKHEMEHTNQEAPEDLKLEVATRIASHHLDETPDYYTKLEALEPPKIMEENNKMSDDLQENPYALWAFDADNKIGNGWYFDDLEQAKNHAKSLGIDENEQINFEIRQRFSGKILLKKNDIKSILNGTKSLEEIYEVGGKIDEYEVAEFIQNQREDAESLMVADMTKLAKTMICKAQIDLAEENIIKDIDYESVMAWKESKKIWEKCLLDIKNQSFYHKDNMMFFSKGGLAYGNSHDNGGIPLVVKSTGQNIEIEGGEGVINKRSMQMSEKLDFEGKKLTPCEIISKINEMGGGVKFKCDDVKEIIENDGDF